MTTNKDDLKNNQIDAEEIEDAKVEGEEEMTENSKSAKSRKKLRKERKADEELNALKEKNEALNDKYLRLFSDFDNFRKRTIKERIELSSTASKDLITDLLPVIDDFERAMSSLEANNPAHEGINLIYNKIVKTLKQKGLEEIEAQGQAFDTDYHEALTNIPAPSDELKGKVVDVVQKGYTLGGKVIRFARVVVGS
jgi:molecular chaperone GrpE